MAPIWNQKAWGFLALCAALLLPSISQAQPTLRVAAPAESSCGYFAVWDVFYGQPFEIVVVLDSDGMDVSGASFNLTPLPPGVFTFNVEYPTSGTLNHGDASAGEYDLEFMGCAPACGQREVLRFQALDTSSVLGPQSDFVMVVSGLGNSEGDPVFRDCDGVEHASPMGGADGGITYSGVEFPDGSLILNPSYYSRAGGMSVPPCDLRSQCSLAVPVVAGSMSVLKARY